MIQINILDRVEELQESGENGLRIAEILKAEKYEYSDSIRTLKLMGFVVIEKVTEDNLKKIQISSAPVGNIPSSVFEGMGDLSALPSVTWS
jgi:hypothetical protein